jgi:hypothetical protein
VHDVSTLTDEQRANLDKLATYLEGLPADYGHFGMRSWIRARSEAAEKNYALNNGGVSSCGTVACAVGHGPAAGILVPKTMVRADGVSWYQYACLFTDNTGYDHEWCFDSEWAAYDNTHHGAAARIRLLLDRGKTPEGFYGPDFKWPRHYAPYRIDAKVPA